MNIEKSETVEYITLKWGTLESWNLTSEAGRDLLAKYYALGYAPSAMEQYDTDEQKALICQMIGVCNAIEIYIDWYGEFVTKDEAKKYVNEYS